MSKKKKTLDGLLEEALVLEDEQPYGLPENWCWVKLGSVITLISGRDISSGVCNSEGKGIPYIMGASNFVDGEIVIERWIEEPTVLGNKGDILLSVKGTIGKILIQEIEKCHLSRQIMGIRVNNMCERKYIYYYFLTYINKLKEISKGVIPGISREDILNIDVPMPPKSIQQQVANKISILFAKLDDAKQLIEEVKATFELRRAAILEKAFSGELTLEYRNVNQCIELVKPLSSSKKFTSQIDQSITSTLYSLPENWKWITLNNLIESMTYGSSAKTDDDSSGKAVLRMGNIQDGSLLNDNLKYLPLNHLDVKKFVLEENDILFNRTNSYELVGKSALVTQEFEGYSFASYLIRLSLIDKEILAPYVVTFINSKIGRKMLLSMVTQQVGQANINSQKLASLPIPSPPKNEIVEINKIIENLKAKERKAIESLNLDVDFANLKQSILSKAFKGELGTNDSTDESAIELLKSMLKEKL